MKTKAKLALIVTLVALLTGCVTRQMIVRSTPAGAPVWVDEEYVGRTPVQVPFTYYGTRKVQVGPVRGTAGAEDAAAEGAAPAEGAAKKEPPAPPAREEVVRETLYESVVKMVKLRAPLYDTFPIDFVTNVLLPFTITHKAEFDFELPPAKPAADEAKLKEEAKAAVERARAFRARALHPAPDELPPAR